MKNKKGLAKKINKSNSVTIRTWILFGIFLYVSFLSLKIILNANRVAASVIIPDPISVQKITSAPHKTLKK